MPHRIALASSDGKVINQHFGHADRFHIVDLNEDNYAFVETRHHLPACNNQEHHNNSFDSILELLADCEGVFVSRIGLGAASYLNAKGLRVFEAPYPIESVLNQLLAEKLLDAAPLDLNNM